MKTKYFKTDYGIDERFLGIIEDSIYYNPQLSKDDKDALVTSLYQLFSEDKQQDKVYTVHTLENEYSAPLSYMAHETIPALVEFVDDIERYIKVGGITSKLDRDFVLLRAKEAREGIIP